MSASLNSARVSDILAQASRARQNRRPGEAASLLSSLVKEEPGCAAAWNMLGLVHLELQDVQAARASLGRAVELEPEQPAIWFNMSRVHQAACDHEDELDTLTRVLTLDAYFLPGILAKGQVLIRLDRQEEAVQIFRAMLLGLGDQAKLPAPLQREVEKARELVQTADARRGAYFETAVGEVAKIFPGADLDRAKAFADYRAGRRKVYLQQPVDSHFPYLPAIEFFNRSLFPWFDRLEQATQIIQKEMLALWEENASGFRPYVEYPPGTPVNQWTELNHSPRWSAWFLWENGARNDPNCARCPETVRIVGELPLLDIPGKGPTVMFSILEPRTHIPPHTGSTNVRTTVHLPLVVPNGCKFRVGAETRDVRTGEAWAFDDTIEHEAWNDSDSPRAILIVDTWNPLLTEPERAAVRMIG